MKKILALFMVVIVFNANCARHKKKSETDFLSATYAVLLDFETGEKLFDRRADEMCAPSSMTKLMTIYLLFSAISEGRVKLEDELPVSKDAQKMTGSRSFFQAGSMAKVEDLVKSIIVHSGNDACVVVAEGLAGDIETFVEEMNEKAKEFGLKNTNFVNPTGMPDEEHYSCMDDIAVISKHIIADFPQFYHYFSEKTFTVNGITQQNRNTLLGNSLGVDGLKTGKTEVGGLGIAVSAENGGKRLIAVVNGCKTAKDRAHDANKLLAIGFREFASFKIAEAGKHITAAKVWLGAKDEVGLCSHEDITVSVPRKYKNQLNVEVTFKEPIEAPIALGAKVGELVYKYGNFVSRKYDLFSCEEVEKADFLERAKLSIKHLIFGGGNKCNEVKKSFVSNPTKERKNERQIHHL